MAQSYEIDVALDSSGVTEGADAATEALSGLAGQAGMVSTALKGAAVAAVAFAGYQGISTAIQSAAQFEEQMLSLRSTVGESAQTVRNLRGDVMNLAATTGQSTQTIVDGFRFARSAGLRMAEAQELVETSTKASAAGFGEQNELVRTATTAMNTWSSEVESGSEFLNTMAAAAQNADIRVSEMSGAFRRNVNIASQLGLELEETLGSLSAISGAVGSASRGGRLFQQVLAGLLKPTNAAAEAISSAVGSVDNLHQTIRDDGLLQALLQLQDNLNQNGRELSDVFRSTRRLEGALALVANEGARARDIMNEAAEATNTIGKAFRNTDGTLRKWRKTQQRFNNLMIKFGTNILPVVNDGLRHMSNFLSTISGNIENVSGVISSDLRRNLRNIENLRVGPPELAQGNPNLITQEQFGQIESNIMSVLKQLERSDAPKELRKQVQSNLNTAIESGFEQGLSGPDIVSRIESVSKQMQTHIKRNVRKGIQDGASEGQQAASEQTNGNGEPTGVSVFNDPFSQSGPDLGLGDFGKAIDGAFKVPEDARRRLSRTARSIKFDFQNSLAEGIRTGFSDGANIGEMLLRDLATTASRSMARGIMDGISRGLMRQTGSTTVSGITQSGLSWVGSFFDTPGVQEVGPEGGMAQFAPGDKFVAGKSEKSMREQLGGGGGGGRTVNQTVENNFPMMSEQKIDRRIQKAAPRIADQAKRQTLQAIRSGGSDGQVARNA